ncbi:putative vacuolar protein sorting-associated protein 13f [Phtheirospermum japonicum]|uniref:Putative vacuolar protein sorting-associated protein 13f n=1 Tax=Phtheirospermum japonicum TaxID=374723 RepID=A0A830BN55_9LAMI|nr:putative vacuolar protein sorting-associated protein 13f [Phtheirospermum japonicum]
MFEGLVRQLILGYLGRYIKDIQNEQLNITLWNDRVGKLSIKIPWKKLGWDPVIIILEDVYICVSQRDDKERPPSEPLPDDATDAQRAELERWKKDDVHAKCYMIASMVPELARKYELFAHAADIKENLESMYSENTRASRYAATKDLVALRLREGASVHEHSSEHLALLRLAGVTAISATPCLSGRRSRRTGRLRRLHRRCLSPKRHRAKGRADSDIPDAASPLAVACCFVAGAAPSPS